MKKRELLSKTELNFPYRNFSRCLYLKEVINFSRTKKLLLSRQFTNEIWPRAQFDSIALKFDTWLDINAGLFI